MSCFIYTEGKLKVTINFSVKYFEFKASEKYFEGFSF